MLADFKVYLALLAVILLRRPITTAWSCMGCFLFVGVLSGSGNKAAGNDDGAELMRGVQAMAANAWELDEKEKEDFDET
jgi:hypothetical protein